MIYPYVLALDLDKSWSEWETSTTAYDPPIWWRSDGYTSAPFTYSNISKTISVRQIEKVFYSAPPPAPSSSGGGFSGGSAGGGFGGGSTSSW